MPRRPAPPLEPTDRLRRLLRPSYTTREVATICDVNRDTVKRWILSGQMPGAVNLGGSHGYLIPRADIKAKLAARAALNAAPPARARQRRAAASAP